MSPLRVIGRMASHAWNWLFGVSIVIGLVLGLIWLLLHYPMITIGAIVGIFLVVSLMIWYDSVSYELYCEDEQKEIRRKREERYQQGNKI